jgi:hypothetical protein
MRQIKLADSFIQNQSLYQNTDQIIVYQISWQREITQALTELHTIRKYLSITHFHTKQRSFILHANVLGSVRQREVAKVWKVVENNAHV